MYAKATLALVPLSVILFSACWQRRHAKRGNSVVTPLILKRRPRSVVVLEIPSTTTLRMPPY
jgi:hypothetical protein